jgi:hypothetical protein
LYNCINNIEKPDAELEEMTHSLHSERERERETGRRVVGAGAGAAVESEDC